MRARTRMVATAVVALGLASCSELTPPDSGRQAEDRWSEVRARLKCQLAAENLAKGQLDEAQEHLAEAIGLNPRGPGGYVLMTRILLERGETASAAEALQEAIYWGGPSAETDYLNGLIAERYARFADALTWYRRASEADPTNAHYVAAVAETLVALDRVAEALALVRDRWTDFGQNATLRALAGEIYLMLGRYEEAAGAYREAAVIAPDDQMLQFQLGLALTFSGNYEEGRTVLSAAGAAPDAPASVLNALGRCHLALGEHEEAKAVARRAVASDPDNLRAWTLLAQAALASGDLLTARRAATRAGQMDPASADRAILLACVCWRQRDYAAAVSALETVLSDTPDDLLALYLLGQCRQATGHLSAARDCYRRALGVNPRCGWAQRFLENGSAGPDATAGRPPTPGGSARTP